MRHGIHGYRIDFGNAVSHLPRALLRGGTMLGKLVRADLSGDWLPSDVEIANVHSNILILTLPMNLDATQWGISSYGPLDSLHFGN